MLRRTVAFLCLASLGALSDRALRAAIFPEREPTLLGRVGENLANAAASPDGRYVAGLREVELEKWTVTVWETASGREVLSARPIPHPPGTTNPLAWSPDSQRVAVGSSAEVNLFEVATGRGQTLKAEWLVRELRFSQDWLLARCDNALFVWTWKNGRLLKRVAQDHLLAATLDQTAGVLAAASFQDSIRLYSLPQGKFVRSLPGGPATTNLEFAQNGDRLAAAFRFREDRSRDLGVYFDWRSGRAVARMSEPDIVGFSVSADGSRFLTRNPGGGHIWNPANGSQLLSFSLPSLHADSLSSDGQWVASLPNQKPEMLLWSSNGQGEPRHLEHAGTPFRFQFFAPGMLQVLDGACSVWKID